MMNAKPDIAVIYLENKQRNSCFLSVNLSLGSVLMKEIVPKSDIQWKIADFLCKYYLKEEKRGRI